MTAETHDAAEGGLASAFDRLAEHLAEHEPTPSLDPRTPTQETP